MRCLHPLVAFSLFIGTTAFSRSPVGEEAHYKLDRDRKRTSSIVKDGTLDFRVLEHLPDDRAGNVYKINYKYELEVAFMGTQTGTSDEKLLTKYFQPGFLEKVRSEKKVETENFKIDHLDIATVETKSGAVYEDCDIVVLYDIHFDRLGPNDPLTQFVKVLESGAGEVATLGFDKVRITAALKQEASKRDGGIDAPPIPIIGAAKIDISARRNGMPVKAGFDYVP